MGSGGTTALLPPDKFFFKCRTLTVLSGADTQSRTGDLTLTKGALYQLSHISTLNLMPGSSLLSHGETPHYHRRYGVSLLSSAWGQVGPPRYGRQANSCALYAILYRISGVGCARKVSHILQYAPSFPSLAALLLRKLLRTANPESMLKILSNPPKQLRRCKVKPHGSLVPVSSTHRCAYTPGLSTSSSSTFLQETLSLREDSSRGKFRA